LTKVPAVEWPDRSGGWLERTRPEAERPASSRETAVSGVAAGAIAIVERTSGFGLTSARFVQEVSYFD
jgi:hypothetical protein